MTSLRKKLESMATKIISLLCSAIIFSVFFYLFYLKNVLDSVEKNKRNIGQLKEEIAMKKTRLELWGKNKKTTAVPAKPLTVPQLMSALIKLSTDNDIEIKAIKPRSLTKYHELNKQVIEMRALGDYKKIINFVFALELQQNLIIDDFSFMAPEKNTRANRLNFIMILNEFYGTL